ncbi:MAG: hypothetical protein JWN76_1164, partial [Chitinophagaceae bacterium]|nr:hypothetical protein [Chitinophagaceae bacterium]
MKKEIGRYAFLTCSSLASLQLSAQTNEYSRLVDVKVSNSEKKTFSDWKSYPTRTIAT